MPSINQAKNVQSHKLEIPEAEGGLAICLVSRDDDPDPRGKQLTASTSERNPILAGGISTYASRELSSSYARNSIFQADNGGGNMRVTLG